MTERPAFETAPIRCGRTRCKWRGYETGMKEVPEIMGGWRCTKRICPACGCDSYSFMTPGEIKAWERAQRAAPKEAVTHLARNVTAINVFIEIDGKHCIALIDPGKAEIFLGMLPAFQHGEKQSAELVTLPDTVTEHLLNTRRAILEHVQRTQRQPPTKPRP